MEEMRNSDILFRKPDWKYFFQNIRTYGRLILKDVDWIHVFPHHIE